MVRIIYATVYLWVGGTTLWLKRRWLGFPFAVFALVCYLGTVLFVGVVLWAGFGFP